MTDLLGATEHEVAAEEIPTLIRPSITFESITFSDGQTIALEEDEIVVFVGPNNAGKSEGLRQLRNWITQSQPQTVIANTALRRGGTERDLEAYLEKHAQKLMRMKRLYRDEQACALKAKNRVRLELRVRAQ